jgi:hypothetical protein
MARRRREITDFFNEISMSQHPAVDGSPLLPRRAFLATTGAALLASGCGYDKYEARLKETNAYFEYLERVNLALDPRPLRIQDVEIRVPKPFESIAPPAAPAEGQAAAEPPPQGEDFTVLGHFPGVHLEGVLATWKANVRVEGAGQAGAAETIAYLHLLGNLERWIAKQTDNEVEPTRYLGDLANMLANTFRVEADTAERPWLWDLMHGFSPYVPKKKIDSIRIEQPQHNPPVDAVFYRFDEVKDVHIALLLILPRAIDPRDKIEERLKHTLETMKVPSQPPKKKSDKPAAAGF